MAEKSRVLCKYHVSGVCRFGAQCAFSHDLADLPNQVCKYYLAGCCAYGDRCRYDHKRPEYWKAKQERQQQEQQQQQRQAQRPQGAGGATNGASGSAAGSAALLSPHASPWGGPFPGEQLPRLPQSLSVDSAAGGGSGSDRRGGHAAAAPNAGAVEVAESWEAIATDPGLPYGDGEEGGEEYDEECGEGEEWADGGEEYDAVAYEGYEEGDGDGNGDGGGLTMVDDDLGLQQEAAAALAAALGRHRPAAAAAAGSTAQLPADSRWAAEQHPWEAAGTAGSTDDPVDPAEVDLCPGFSLHGHCGEGEDCPLVHGLECEICHKFRIHPYNEEAAEEHRATCRLRHERLEARLRSRGVECGICLEQVLSKPSVSERRFGLMACDHAFCLPCIRSWRGRTDDETLATDTAVRTCPICRTPTHFVTPSLVWPSDAAEKAAIVDAYKARLAAIDCKHFDFGEGTCPFSTSCFYRHMYKDGRMEEPTLRRAGNADGGVRVVMPVRLSAFFDSPGVQQLLTRRR